MSDHFEATIDEACQRGMHIRYSLQGEVPSQLTQRVSEAFGDTVLVGEERLGDTVVRRAVLPFRFEIRHGLTPRSISLLQRFSATEEQRLADRSRFEDLLERLLTGHEEPAP